MSVIYAMIYCNIFYLIYLDIDFQKKKKKYAAQFLTYQSLLVFNWTEIKSAL